MAPWNIIDTRFHLHSASNSASEGPRTDSPPRVTEPDVTAPPRSDRMTARPSVLLPHALAPATPTHSPLSALSDAPSRALTGGAPPPPYSADSPLTSRNATPPPPRAADLTLSAARRACLVCKV